MFKALWRAFVEGLIDYDEKVASKNNSQGKTRVQNHTLSGTKLAKIDNPTGISN